MSSIALDPPTEVLERARTRGRHAVLLPLRRTAWVVFTLQFLMMAAWSANQYSRFALASDAATYIQAFHLLANAVVNPFSSIHRIPFIQDHFELLAWPLSVFDRLGPQGLAMLWAQDLFVVLGEVAAFTWMRHVVTTNPVLEGSAFSPKRLLALGLVLLVVDPWSYWAIAFDIHIETFAIVFVVMAAFEFSRGNTRRGWVWATLLLFSGDVPATWVIGLGISALVAGHRSPGSVPTRYRDGSLLIGVSVLWFALLALIGAHRGSRLLAEYGYLAVAATALAPKHLSGLEFVKGVITHPANVIGALWHKRLNVFAHIAPTGIVGTFTTWSFGVCLVVLLQTNLANGVLFSFEPFQNLTVLVFVAVGTIVVLAWLATRYSISRRVGAAVLSILLAFALAWGAVWIPAAFPNWIRVSSAQASELSKALKMIPESAEVIVQGGVAGRFAERPHIYILSGPGGFPVSGRWVWFVLAPSAGIELVSTQQATSYLHQLAGPLGATLEAHGSGIWVFRWRRPRGVRTVRMTPKSTTLDAWAIPTNGRIVVSGAVSNWHVESQGRSGYLTFGDYWGLPTGDYEARVRLASASPLNVEVWNATSGALVARAHVLPTHGVVDVELPFAFTKATTKPKAFSGFGPVAVLRGPPPPEDQLEVRVWTPTRARASVYNVSLLAHHEQVGARGS